MSDAQPFRKKPVEVEAIRYEGETIESYDRPRVPAVIRRFVGAQARMARVGSNTHGGPHQWLPVIHTEEGDMVVSPGDWIIRGVEGEFYPCKPSIFDATYEPVPRG